MINNNLNNVNNVDREEIPEVPDVMTYTEAQTLLLDSEHIKKDDYCNKYDQFEDNNTGLIVRQSMKETKKTKKKALGMVLMASRDYYDNKTIEELKSLHIMSGESPLTLVKIIYAIIRVSYNEEVDNILIGHEHGEKNGKCHGQIIIFFKNENQKLFYPGEFKYNGITYLYRSQTARNPKSLTTYCKKDGDYTWLYPSKTIRFVHKKDKMGNKLGVDAFLTIAQNPEIPKEDKMDLLITHAPQQFMMGFKNIRDSIEYMSKPVAPLFRWNMPSHIAENPRFGVIHRWFERYCLPEDLKRRKALVIYGQRGSGKTEFAKSLVNDPAYYVYFRSNFNQEDIKGNKKEY